MRAVVYDRVSVKDASSQEEHLRRCRAYCKSQSWTVVAEHVDTASGYKRDVVRPGWEQVRLLVEGRKVDVVLVFAMSRAGRNAASLLAFVELCQDHDVKLVSATEPIDTGSAYGTIIVSVLAAVAQIESAMKSERAVLGRDVARREGTWPGGRRPYGFRPVKTNGEARLVLDEEEAEHIRRAAEIVLNGGSLNSASRVMNNAGARSITGQPWYAAAVGRLLSRDVNAPDILTASTLSKVRRAVKKRKPAMGPRPRYLLTGIAYCGVCGGKLSGKPVAGVPKYVCLQPDQPLHLSIRADLADADVLSKTELLQPPSPETVEDPGAVPKDLARELREVESKLEDLGEQVESGQLSDAAFRGRERKLAARVEELQRQIEAALPKGADLFARLLKEMEEENGPGEATPDEQREWVELLVERVVIKPGRSNRVDLYVREGVEPV